MSTSTAGLRAGADFGHSRGSALSSARAYFASDSVRTIQTALGLIWLLDGALQFQSFMYGNGFIQMLKAMTPGQPYWISSSMNWAANLLHSHQALLNTPFALVQVAIGIGLLYRPTVKLALALSFVWALFVWWFGEAFGMLFMNMANALTGAPGAVLIYGLVGLIVWPNGRPGGLIGVRGARISWAALWVLNGGLWLLAVNSSANATRTLINAAPSGMSWLSTVQNWAANAAQGNGLIIALVLASVSFTIGIAVAVNWHPRTFLIAAIVLNLAYWVLGQGLGGIFQGGATDPNAGPVFVLLACALYALVPSRASARAAGRARAARLAVPIALLALLLAGCASADKTASTAASVASSSSTSSGMAGMNMGASSAAGSTGKTISVDGIKPVPTQVLATTTWQGMKIEAMATTPVPFVIYNGTSEQLIKPGKASFHLMVMLSDADTGVAIPYSTVWATISKGGNVVYDERQWPMISRYMGPHYGNDVKVPGAGTYQLSLLVSPPVSARHVEYQNVWLAPHRVNFTFHWSGV